MPKKLYQNNNTGEYYTRIFVPIGNGLGRNATKQISRSGYQWLRSQGIQVNDQIPNNAYWYLDSMGWLGTKGELDEAGPPVDAQPETIDESLARVAHLLDQLGVRNPDDTGVVRGVNQTWNEAEPDDELLTIPTATARASAPRFMYDRSSGLYYTIIQVLCSSTTPLTLPLLIKHRGAMWLLRNGAGLGEEFTEYGLQLLFERRWCYMDEARMSAW